MNYENFKYEAIGCGIGIVSTAVICSLLNVSKQKFVVVVIGGAVLGTLVAKHISGKEKSTPEKTAGAEGNTSSSYIPNKSTPKDKLKLPHWLKVGSDKGWRGGQKF